MRSKTIVSGIFIVVMAFIVSAVALAGTMNEINVQPLPNGAFTAPQHVDARVLAANTAETHTFATGCAFVRFSSTADFYAAWDGGTAAVPAADVTDGTAPERNPDLRYVVGQATVSLVSAGTPVITIACYKWTR